MSKLKVLTGRTESKGCSSPQSYHAALSETPICSYDSPCLIEPEQLEDAFQSIPEIRKSSYFSRKNADAANLCICCSGSTLPPAPAKWPQRSILLRPSSGSGMQILGVRHSSSNEYMSLSTLGYCEGCTLPINNGDEKSGECIVVDFETEIFIGTLLLRVRNIPPPLSILDKEKVTYSDTNENEERLSDEHYYFNKKRRTFQATVKGRFKKHGIPMSECVTGQLFSRPAGYLPPRLIVKGAVSIISRLAPQLQARIEGDCPRFLSPLVSTAQTVLAHRINKDAAIEGKGIEDDLREPKASDHSSMIQSIITSGTGKLIGIHSTPSDKTSQISRIRTRKRAFDKINAQNIKTPTFDLDKEYTFEFFQHLITFDDFCLDFAKPIGKHPLHVMLNGQPLKFMAAHQTISEGKESLNWLWCFDLWHASLYEDARIASEEENDY